MIIVRVPFRIGLIGGSTDFPAFYNKEPGAVLNATINHSLYVCVRRQLGLVEHKIRLNYSKVENCDDVDQVEHPIIREAFRFYEVNEPIEVTTWSDIPSHCGLGSSSSFAVGLVTALEKMLKRDGTERHPEIIAEIAAGIEIDVLKRPVGKQDHYAASFGGMNVFRFEKSGVYVKPVQIPDWLSDRLLLLYTGIKRDAGHVLKSQDDATEANRPTLRRMVELVWKLNPDFSNFGSVMDEGWQLKRSLSPDVSSPRIDYWCHMARENGAIGAKLIGAGGGGFLLLDADPKDHARILEAVPLYRVPFKFSQEGATIIYDSEVAK